MRMIASLHRQLSAARHGITCIHRQVHDHLLDLSRIRFHHPEAGVQRSLQFDIFTQQAQQQLLHVVDDRVQVEHLGLEHLAAAERQQLPGKGSGALGGSAISSTSPRIGSFSVSSFSINSL